jgi:predicted nucleic acid-binding protein
VATGLVLDASAAAAWLLPDEDGPDIGDGPLHVPWLFWFEIRNILVVAERRGRLEPGIAEAFLEALDLLGPEVDALPSSTEVLRLARDHRLTAYDAAYLELARRRTLPLATRDAALARAARSAGVPAA